MKMHILLRITVILTVLSLSGISCTSHGIGKPIRVQDYQKTIRVACVGDSITYGHGIENRLKACYPAQLGRMLGDKWEVRNFGVSGATMLKRGDLPYWQQPAFKDVLAYNPDVVIIKLGTNDTKPQNWKFKDQFARDYADMIDRFSELPARPRIWICYPVPAFAGQWGINEFVIKNEVIPIISQVSRKTGVLIINLYQPLSDKPKYFPDDIHPNAEGVMKRHGIAINDLYSFALPRLGEIQRPKNVHFTEAGSKLLAQQVAHSILKALEER